MCRHLNKTYGKLFILNLSTWWRHVRHYVVLLLLLVPERQLVDEFTSGNHSFKVGSGKSTTDLNCVIITKKNIFSYTKY